MEYVKSKDLYGFVNETLGLWDSVIIEHGVRVAYIMYHMLKVENKYVEYEIADICLLAKYHDIGAYQTNPGQNIFDLESAETMKHAIFGYLFFRHLSPLSDKAKIILHHHSDESKYGNLTEEELYLTRIIKLADIADVYDYKLGDKFEPKILRKLEHNTLATEALDLYYKALENCNFHQKLKDGTYKDELKEFLDNYLILSNEETKIYLEMLMYVLGAKKHSYLVNVVTCSCICQTLGEIIGLEDSDLEILQYASMLHDLGMIYVPSSILDAPRKLTADERAIVEGHVGISEKIMDEKILSKVLEIIVTHHERGDGSGYPNHLHDEDFSDLQRILQIADITASLINTRAYRGEMSKDEVVKILSEEVAANRLNREIVSFLIENFEEIYEETRVEQAKVLNTYERLLNNYHTTCKALE